MMTDQSRKKSVKRKFLGSRFSCWILFILLAASLLLLFPITRKIHHYQMELEGVRHQIARLNDEEKAELTKNTSNVLEAFKDSNFLDPSKGARASEDEIASNELNSGDQFSNGQQPSDQQSGQRVISNKMSRFSRDSMPVLTGSGENAKSRSSMISELLNKSEAGQARMERWGRTFRILRTGIIIFGFMLIYCVYISRQREEDLPQDVN